MDRSMLSRATESTDAPTPGYLYIDLAKHAASSPTVCQDMALYLTRRLASKNNPNIKYKCCKVIAKLSDNVPRNQFRRCIAQDSSAVSSIKDAMNFRGTPDPVRGDEPNQKVRIAAKEALDAVYRETPSSEMAHHSSSSSYPGISSSPSPHGAPGGYNGGGGGSGGGYGAPGGAGGGGRRMEGIGNPRYTDPRMDPRYNNPGATKLQNAVKEAGEVVMGMIKDPLARNLPGSSNDFPRQGHSGNLPGYGGSYGLPPPGAAELSRQTGGQWTMASNRGPGAVNPSYGEAYKPGGGTATPGTVGGSWASAPAAPPPPPGSHYGTPSVTVNSVPGAVGSGGGGIAASDGSYEKNLVVELCPPGGMKPVPPPDKLANFARSVSSLNSELICPVLLDMLEDGQPWVIRAKALCVMETCIQSGQKEDGTNPYRDFFHACHEEISPLSAHPRAAIKEPATRLLKLLGINPTVAAAAPPVSAPAAAPTPNLLDFDDTPSQAQASPPVAPPSQPPPPPPPEAPPGTAAGPAASSSLFGGMQVKSGPAQSVATTAAPVAAPIAPAVAAPSPSSGNLLDFDASAAISTASPDVPAVAAHSASNGQSDVFSSVNNAGSSVGSVSGSDMFARMTLKSEDKKTEEVGGEPASAAAPSSSAFGFINESASKAGESDADTAPPPPADSAPTPESFDPLKNVTPNTAQRKMMTLSQEQMQAMAYQQMMMQQQFQYMQMMAAGAAARGGAPMPPMFNPAAAAAAVGGPVRRSSSGTVPTQAMGNLSFAPRPVKKDDKKFDFVKDAMQTANKKK